MTLQEQIEGWNNRYEMSLILGCYSTPSEEAKEIIRKQAEMLKVAKEALYDVEAESDNLPAWVYTKLAKALATIEEIDNALSAIATIGD